MRLSLTSALASTGSEPLFVCASRASDTSTAIPLSGSQAISVVCGLQCVLGVKNQRSAITARHAPRSRLQPFGRWHADVLPAYEAPRSSRAAHHLCGGVPALWPLVSGLGTPRAQGKEHAPMQEALYSGAGSTLESPRLSGTSLTHAGARLTGGGASATRTRQAGAKQARPARMRGSMIGPR